MNTESWIIIPDVHGRRFWRDAVNGHEEENIIFLGDYLDPYSREGISPLDASGELKDIIEFKKGHPENVVLLLGNHDLCYLDDSTSCSRHDYFGERRNRALLEDNIGLFDLVHEARTESGMVLFSHAGLCETWLRANDRLFGAGDFRPGTLNALLHDPDSGQREDLMYALGQISAYRCGYDPAGSVVWADIREISERDDLLSGYTHIFGHTMQADGMPKEITSGAVHGWCLDCLKAFRMDSDGTIRELGGQS